ncbi:hypothetical protein E2C01_036345 [Portunus trituberculatus]|uniref:Uncharacterized protein n=1 Tax=Portunus trituberculatus TaxID=210409 RepID=A0A5B7FAX9_PORTR|nr:hypothetical protein [Portunus trituberculatus]
MAIKGSVTSQSSCLSRSQVPPWRLVRPTLSLIGPQVNVTANGGSEGVASGARGSRVGPCVRCLGLIGSGQGTTMPVSDQPVCRG